MAPMDKALGRAYGFSARWPLPHLPPGKRPKFSSPPTSYGYPPHTSHELSHTARTLDPRPRWQSTPDVSTWRGRRAVHRQDVATGTDALAFRECPVPFDRHLEFDALTAAQVQDLRLLEARAHPEPNGEDEGFHACESYRRFVTSTRTAMHLSTSSDVQGLMPLIVPLITSFLNEVSKLPPQVRMRRIHRMREAMSDQGSAPRSWVFLR
jgi:hypothetical protein